MNNISDLPLLTEKQELEIIDAARDLRNVFGSNDAPIANDIFLLLEKRNISLIQYPIEDDGNKSFGAMFLTTTDADIEFNFIGLNTNDYYDKQIFTIAHELYHYIKKDQWHISRDNEDKSEAEILADKFAAEFLLPIQIFKYIIIAEFGKSEISDFNRSTMLRFIARIQCTWWLPYKAIVRRLYEAKSINEEIYRMLYNVDERKSDGEYFKIGIATDERNFRLLNNITRKIGANTSDIETLIRNFEDGIISESELINDLALFEKDPEDYGITIEIDDGDIAELNKIFSEEKENGN